MTMAKSFAVLGVMMVLWSLPVGAQFTPEEVAQRPMWEEFLRTAEVVAAREVGEGVTRPYVVTLRQGDRETRAIWKTVDQRRGTFVDTWRYEVAAYELDKYLGLHMIPPAVERVYRRYHGAMILFVEHKYNLIEVVDKKIPIPTDRLDHYNKMKYLARAFDSLIANEDRTQQNMLFTDDWRMILIDHSRAFRWFGRFRNRLLFGMHARPARPFRQLPRTFVERLKALDEAQLKALVGAYLKDEEMRGVLRRQKMILAEVKEMIQQRGEANVLY